MIEATNLEFTSEKVDVTPILIVSPGILPYLSDFLLERRPALQEGHVCRLISAFDTTDRFLYTFEGDGVPYDFVIIYNCSGWKVNER